MTNDHELQFDGLSPQQYVLANAIAFALISAAAAAIVGVVWASTFFLLLMTLLLLRIWMHENRIRQWIVGTVGWVACGTYLVVTRGWIGALMAIPKIGAMLCVCVLIGFVVKKLS